MSYRNITALGLLKTSLIDFPGRVAAVLFTKGCSFRCPFCHNPELTGDAEGPVPPDFVPAREVLAFLDKRRRVLDGVVITGGEPLSHAWIGEIAGMVKSRSLALKIDTNGSYPERLEEIAPDYVAVDVKCAPDRYHEVTNSRELADRTVAGIKRTVAWVLAENVEHEFRTTVVPGLVDIEGFERMLDLIEGVNRYVLQAFRPGRTLDPEFSRRIPYPAEVLGRMKAAAERRGIRCLIRATRATRAPALGSASRRSAFIASI